MKHLKLIIFILFLFLMYKNNHKENFENRYYNITENFLEDDYIDNIYDKITSIDHWVYTTNNGNEKIKNNNNKKEREKNSFKLYNNNKFSYSKYEYDDDELIKDIERYLTSENILKIVSEKTGEKLVKVMDIFISKYEKNNFLSKHTDRTLGKYAFMIYLNKSWDKNCGGNLNIIKNDNTIDTLIPKYNRLVLMDIYSEERPHFIDEVICDKSRYAITGWFA